jgi:hypothetical protein
LEAEIERVVEAGSVNKIAKSATKTFFSLISEARVKMATSLPGAVKNVCVFAVDNL